MLPSPQQSQPLRLVLVGHVDHGKSTVLGRMLADIGALPDGKLEEIERTSARLGKRFEYAFLLDALADERSQGITIDAARIHFSTDTRRYLCIDAPGHVEFLKNMVTGASRADVALLVIDAAAGLEENSRRHAYLLSLLGIRQVLVVCNKMDLVSFDQQVFRQLEEDCRTFLSSVQISPTHVIPLSGEVGENIVARSEKTSWYKGPTLFEALEQLEAIDETSQQSLRMYVQDVYKFTKFEDDRRIIVGTIDSGSIAVGDSLTFFPSGKTSAVKTIEQFGSPPDTRVTNGCAVGFTLEEQMYVRRGQLVAHSSGMAPRVSSRLRGSLFWLGRTPLTKGKEYTLRIGTAAIPAHLKDIHTVLNSSSLETREEGDQVLRNEVADCTWQLKKVAAFDEVETAQKTSRFVIVDGRQIAGGGIIHEALLDQAAAARAQAFLREKKWISSGIAPHERAERFSQRPALILVTGARETPRKEFARMLESQLFAEGHNVYYCGMGNIIHGLDSDINADADVGNEHVRRLAEVANLLLHTGIIFIVSAVELSEDDISLVRGLVRIGELNVFAFGESDVLPETDLSFPASHHSLAAAQSQQLGPLVQQAIDLLKSKSIVS